MFGRHSCRSWRPRTDTPHEQHHLPGKCRRCWQLCSRSTTGSAKRCETCEFELAQHPDSRIRMALVREGTASESILSLLTNDHDASVADLAKTASYRLSHSIRRPLSVTGAASSGSQAEGRAAALPAVDLPHPLTDQDVRHG